MMFDVAAEAYGQFMGRYSEPLAAEFVSLVGARRGQRALDVGCGPGALTAKLVDRLGSAAVSAIDPSPSFVAALRTRLPEVDVRSGVAEQLPFADGAFDLCLAQLVVHFMADPVAGIAEMARVTKPGGTVGASVWDHAGGGGPLSVFWRAVQDLDPGAHDESTLAGTREGQLGQLCREAGLHAVESSLLTVEVAFATYDDWWRPFTLGVGPAGAYVAQLDDAQRERLRARCAEMLPEPSFRVSASAWCVTARAG